MIKVIKHGYARYQTQCDNCKCEFEYELEDIQNRFVKCPDCGEKCLHNSTLNVLWGTRMEEKQHIKGKATYHYCPICKKPLIRIDSTTNSLAQPYKCTNCDRLFTASELEGIITTAEIIKPRKGEEK